MIAPLAFTRELRPRHWWSRREMWHWDVRSVLSVYLGGGPVIYAEGWTDTESEALEAIGAAVVRMRMPRENPKPPNYTEHGGW